MPQLKRRGTGRMLIEALEQEARENDLESIFAFTYVTGFFDKLGFSEVERGELPLKAWKDCLRCPKFQNCDEIAVLKRLAQHQVSSRHDDFDGTRTEKLIQLPTICAPSFR
jgi:amino-acid N-acetyltransferase